MSAVVVADASPLILLAAVGRLDLLRSLYGRVVVPPAVWREVVLDGRGRPGCLEVRDAAWIDVAALRDPERAERKAAELGPGEAEAFGLYEELGAELVLVDDLRARSYAMRNGIAILGTAGVLLGAKRFGFLGEVREALDAVRAAGLFLSEAQRRRVLRLAGEAD